jgi:hypothetical protein
MVNVKNEIIDSNYNKIMDPIIPLLLFLVFIGNRMFFLVDYYYKLNKNLQNETNEAYTFNEKYNTSNS